jgi:hypothetical protein
MPPFLVKLFYYPWVQVVEENVGLKSEIEALEAEIAEVQDTFREKDAKEFKRVKWELGEDNQSA